MQVRIKRKNYKIYAFDIESHNDFESILLNKTSTWLGSFIDDESKVDDEESYVYSIKQFIDKLEILSNPKRKHGEKKKPCKNLCIYIFNLAFEWSFILPVILKRGYKFKEEISKDDEFSYNSVSTKSVSSVWQISLKCSKKGGNIIFRDLAKIFSGSLENVAKSFNLPTQKDSIIYDLNRLRNLNDGLIMNHFLKQHERSIERLSNLYKKVDKPIQDLHKLICKRLNLPVVEKDFKYTPTTHEKEYCFKDTRIIVDILQKMNERKDKIFFNVSSMATYACKSFLQYGYRRSYKPYSDFRKEYPLLGQEENEFLRNSVGGGICYAPSGWQFKVINQKILHIDLHQAHPSQAFYHYFPYGEGVYKKGEPIYKSNTINCIHIKVSYDDVKLHSIIKLIGLDFVTDKELTIWDFELPLMKQCYVNLKVTYIDYYEYKAKPLTWRNYYKHNYLMRLKAKEEKDLFLVLYYKLLNNSSYGKLLEKPHNEVFENIVRDDGIIDSNILVKDKEEINAKFTYLPVGSAIPAYTRVQLVSTALMFGWQKVVYFDTDSIFIIYDEETKAIWKSNKINKKDFLGGWGLEEIIDTAQFTAPKRYKTITNGVTTIKCAGINFKKVESLNFEETNIINATYKVQRAYRVEGGTLIKFQNKEIGIQEKYYNIYERNTKDNEENKTIF